jgi:predicted lysophospholipase L1 biosynthesis ABC-type transport system permease subunit
MGHDLRQALRALARRPALSSAILVTLSLVIGASVVLVSVVQGLLFDIRMLADRMTATVWQQQTSAAVLGGLGILALVLAAVGVYGVLAHAVSQRHREIGVHRALGARDVDVLRLVVVQGMRPVAFGVVIGGGLALAGARALGRVLYGVPSHDPVSLVAAPLALALVALAACCLPTRRALAVDPNDALRID